VTRDVRRATCHVRLDHDSPAEYLRNFVAILYIRSRIIPDLCVPVYSERDAAKESSATQLPQKSAPKQYKREFNAGDLFMKARRRFSPPGCEGSSNMLRKACHDQRVILRLQASGRERVNRK
jgi:hypothetical protein